ncbi:hypothetical protein GE061_004812 [Apolygus lucorum]|uniref:Peptidase C1A papain C-terminal domain-containing protein n=1 Tax=Apolygus lucorum TaxID=248454 RepID=A0A6A4IU55_APOLU|nr:hypothetical protein GE061_004812 [Apolygus lucorum]
MGKLIILLVLGQSNEIRCVVMKEVLIFVTYLSASAALSCGDASAPLWPKAYTAAGRIVVPKASVDEPFVAYYDESASSSRIDYWDGHVKTFQNADSDGYMLRIVPVIPGTQHKVLSCFRQKSAHGVTPQTVLPDLKNYKCADTDVIDGVQNQKWVFYDKRYMRNVKFTMLVKIDVKDPSQIVPLVFEVKVQDILLGVTSDHYFIYFDSYEPSLETVPNWKSEIDESLPNCTQYPNSTSKSHNYFNPMAEFVSNTDEHITDEWEEYKKKYKKMYAGLDNHMRRLNFKQNYRFVHSMNRAGLTYKTRINQFADWKDEELSLLRGRQYNGGSNNASVFPAEEILAKEVPASMDWRLYGAITPVKDQGLCGGGWAYAATGALEGSNFQRTGTLVSLSEQALMDCSWAYGNAGCDGGDDYKAFKWAANHGGLPLSDEYGSVTQEGICHVDQLVLQGPITEYVNVTSNDPAALRAALSTIGPISVALHASAKSFIFYSHGIYTDSSCKNSQRDLDHYALLIGYGELRNKKYWLVKNSWSALWGNDGYILIAVDDNICGVMTSPTYVTT